MTVNIYDTANQLERELRQTPQYQALVAAHEAINSDEQAKETFTAFQEVTMAFQQAQMTGEAPDDALIERAQKVSEAAQGNEKIQAMMAAEQQLSTLFNDINRIITKPLQELYNQA